MFEGSLLIGIDISGVEGTIALVSTRSSKESSLLAQHALTGRNRSAEIVPQLDALLRETGTKLVYAAAIVVVSGPGSFTGLRVGISAAKAFSEALDIPVIAISRLEVLSVAAGKDAISVLDAGRGEFYVRRDSGPDAVETIESASILSMSTNGMRICVCESALAGRLIEALIVPAPTAFDAVRAALPRFYGRIFDDVATLDANYVRRPYADIASTGAKHI